MSKLLSKPEFAEADITFNETIEYKYLFHLAVFDDTTMDCEQILKLGSKQIQAIVLTVKIITTLAVYTYTNMATPMVSLINII